jgi:hypothetical protein
VASADANPGKTDAVTPSASPARLPRSTRLKRDTSLVPRRHPGDATFPRTRAALPERGRGDRLAHFIRYFDRWPKSLRTKIKDPMRVAQTFSVLLQGDLIETALLAGRIPAQKELRTRAQDAATGLLTLIKAGLL